MARPKIGELLVKLDKLLDRYVESGFALPISSAPAPLPGTEHGKR